MIKRSIPLETITKDFPPNSFATFLTNHDQEPR